jgi:hypothetical protein
LSYHRNPNRWSKPGELQLVGRGQEFVADVGNLDEPAAWLEAMIETIEKP